eukprot:4030417-Pyramimonas_sp.AAC.1
MEACQHHSCGQPRVRTCGDTSPCKSQAGTRPRRPQARRQRGWGTKKGIQRCTSQHHNAESQGPLSDLAPQATHERQDQRSHERWAGRGGMARSSADNQMQSARRPAPDSSDS